MAAIQAHQLIKGVVSVKLKSSRKRVISGLPGPTYTTLSYDCAYSPQVNQEAFDRPAWLALQDCDFGHKVIQFKMAR